mmetsp:Transcript_47444/g.78641  ORF Transcript_47444/g.78641 Transcript_47444/m.78641 type:complete len:454 (+) Transcript_47444:130-1491(+)
MIECCAGGRLPRVPHSRKRDFAWSAQLMGTRSFRRSNSRSKKKNNGAVEFQRGFLEAGKTYKFLLLSKWATLASSKVFKATSFSHDRTFTIIPPKKFYIESKELRIHWASSATVSLQGSIIALRREGSNEFILVATVAPGKASGSVVFPNKVLRAGTTYKLEWHTAEDGLAIKRISESPSFEVVSRKVENNRMIVALKKKIQELEGDIQKKNSEVWEWKKENQGKLVTLETLKRQNMAKIATLEKLFHESQRKLLTGERKVKTMRSEIDSLKSNLHETKRELQKRVASVTDLQGVIEIQQKTHRSEVKSLKEEIGRLKNQEPRRKRGREDEDPEILPGTSVKASWKHSEKSYHATVYAINADGTFHLIYGDNDEWPNCPRHAIKEITARPKKAKTEKTGALKVGTPVKAQKNSGTEWIHAEVFSVNDCGTYHVIYADSTEWEKCPRSKIKITP